MPDSRHTEEPALARDKELAFAALTDVAHAVEQGRADDAGAAAGRLLERFRARAHLGQDGDGALPGFGAMVLDAALWLIGAGRPHEALDLCDALVTELGHGNQSERAVAAGAHFLAAQAAGRQGDATRSRAEVEALCGMGEAALAGLDRLTTRLVAAGADPAWHAQLAAASVTVLWRLGRGAEARAIAAEAATAFERHGDGELARMLLALERELSRGEN
ncbi:MAG TPA: hypothetical protein VFN65_14200 [Solirubrobacteraceae bacterium]|nr:hypothetical protein [Solirubrobacteraceae bacterium]